MVVFAKLSSSMTPLHLQRPNHPLLSIPPDIIPTIYHYHRPQSGQELALSPSPSCCLPWPLPQSQWRQRQKRGSGTRLTNPVGLSPRNRLLACNRRSPSLPQSRGPVEAALQQRMYVTIFPPSSTQDISSILVSISIIRHPTVLFLATTRKDTTLSYQTI